MLYSWQLVVTGDGVESLTDSAPIRCNVPNPNTQNSDYGREVLKITSEKQLLRS
jgi:hypothetical protein